jgi:hypothetical protein
MDRSGWDANTDNLVVVDPARRRVLWIPRDLWSDRVDDRISRAFANRGHEGLAGALAEHGVHVRHSVCLKREAVERALRDVVVSVPVVEQMRFWYPLSPTRPLEEGRKLVCFDPPAETLAGERIHQWVGARRRVGRASSDFERIERQQVFLARLLEKGFPFSRALADPQLVSMSSRAAISELRAVEPSWAFDVLDDVEPATVRDKLVLMRVPRQRRVLRRLRAVWRAVRGPGRNR